MTGEELYNIYRREHEKRDCLVDKWEHLYETEREVWNAVAKCVV